MTKNSGKIKLLIAGLGFLSSIVSPPVAFSQENDQYRSEGRSIYDTERGGNKVGLNWSGGQFISWCETTGGDCISGKMSNKIGKVEKVVKSSMLSGVATSWVALTKNRSYLCALISDSHKVACAEISGGGGAKDMNDVNVLHIKYALKKPVNLVSTKFSKALSDTKISMQTEIGNLSRSMAFASTTSVCDTADPPPPSDDPVCEVVDSVQICTDTGSPSPDPSDPGEPSEPPPGDDNLPGGGGGGGGTAPGTAPSDPVRQQACFAAAYRAWTQMDAYCDTQTPYREVLVCKEVNMRLYTEELAYCRTL